MLSGSLAQTTCLESFFALFFKQVLLQIFFKNKHFSEKFLFSFGAIY